MTLEKPRLRPVEAVPVRHDGQTLVALRDPERLTGELVIVPAATFLILALMDGTRTLREVQAEIQRHFQQLLPVAELEGLVSRLDELCLLDNERAHIRREDLIREFDRLPARPAAHAGTAYPAEPDELRRVLEGFFHSPDGPGADGRPEPGRSPRGLITPHIDLSQGGPTMAWAFNELRVPDPPELYVILGVAHRPTPNLYTLTEKDFETPLGRVRTHREAAARLKALYGAERLAGQYAHRFEHSIEFQTIFLRHLHQGGPEFGILPILCGSMEEELTQPEGSPRERPDVAGFCEAIRRLMEEFGPRVCLIAGVDLSHVGLKFGHQRGVDDFQAELIRAADRRMLECVERRDSGAFFNHFRADLNARNVDAVTAVYTLLEILGPGPARLLKYEQYREAATESLVSYASVALD